jgi:hypothetical protein
MVVAIGRQALTLSFRGGADAGEGQDPVHDLVEGIALPGMPNSLKGRPVLGDHQPQPRDGGGAGGAVMAGSRQRHRDRPLAAAERHRGQQQIRRGPRRRQLPGGPPGPAREATVSGVGHLRYTGTVLGRRHGRHVDHLHPARVAPGP